MKKKRQYHQGKYEIKNWDKYLGESAPRYLSSWERVVFEYLDNKKGIVKWGAETVIVPYFNPIKERKSRYMVDIYAEYIDSKGILRKEILEVKPKAQCKKPIKTPRKKQTTYDEECRTWVINNAKWQAAEQYAQTRGWGFRVITEDDIFR